MGKEPKRRIVNFVVGDPKLDIGGGINVGNLEEMKNRLMAIKNTDTWDLVIRMHGADDALGIAGADAVYGAKGIYTADSIKKLFDDKDFQKWRQDYGPARTSMNSCNLDSKFEAVILAALNKPGGNQRPQGLGKGCHPHTEIVEYTDSKNRSIKTRERYAKLSASEKTQMLETLKELNKKFGYFGNPPVDESLILHYYFDEQPQGSWVVVTVGTGSAQASKNSGISFYNRAVDARFVGDLCTGSIGTLKKRESAVPAVPD